MFRVGQRVICIDATPYNGDWADGVDPLIQGAVFTISRSNYPSPIFTGGVVISVRELTNPYGYFASRFRPVVSRPTDISAFTKMLTDERLGDLVVLQRVLERVK